jgi:hypothetical protein
MYLQPFESVRLTMHLIAWFERRLAVQSYTLKQTSESCSGQLSNKFSWKERNHLEQFLLTR